MAATSAALLTGVLVGTAGPAWAEAPGRVEGTAVASAPATVSTDAGAAARGGASTAEQAAAYWTPERMRTAVPADTLVADRQREDSSGSADRSAPEPTGPARIVPPAAPVESLPPTPAGAGSSARGVRAAVDASHAVGKVFFRNPSTGTNHVCSASSLNSNSGRLVLTAGHCVHGGRGGQWMQNWVFVPYYNYGAEPHGRWAAKTLGTFQSWVTDTDMNRDIGFVTVWPDASGQRLLDVVSGHGFAANFPYEQFLTILAYPAAAPYDGGWQQACEGTTARYLQEPKIQLRCGFTGGASGSPWLMDYDGELGLANGVMSTLTPSTGMNRSPYFDTAVMDMFNTAQNWM